MADLDGGTPTARGDLVRRRRGTAQQWADANPLLASGEEGIELDTGIVKRAPAGGGYWTDLPDSNVKSAGRVAAGVTIALGG